MIDLITKAISLNGFLNNKYTITKISNYIIIRHYLYGTSRVSRTFYSSPSLVVVKDAAISASLAASDKSIPIKAIQGINKTCPFIKTITL